MAEHWMQGPPMSHEPPQADAAQVLGAWQRLRFALGAAGIGTWHLDLQTHVATYDDNLNRIFGLDPVETQGPLDERLARIHPDDRARVRDAVDEAIATRSEFTIEFRVVRPDGAIVWLRDRGRIVADARGVAVSATGAVMDITEQRRLEEHDRLLAHATQAFAATDDHEATLAALGNDLVPRFADACAVHLREGEGIRRLVCGGDVRLAPP